MESLCVVVRENAGELVDSARLSWAAKCGEAAASVVRGFSAGPLGDAMPIPAADAQKRRLLAPLQLVEVVLAIGVRSGDLEQAIAIPVRNDDSVGATGR